MSGDEIKYHHTPVYGETIQVSSSGSAVSLSRNYEVGMFKRMTEPEKLEKVYYMWVEDSSRDIGISLTEEHMEALVRHYLKLKLEMMEERGSGDSA